MGLIRGVARTAVVAGTATAVSNRVSRRQANKWSGQEQEQAAQEEQAAKAQAYDQQQGRTAAGTRLRRHRSLPLPPRRTCLPSFRSSVSSKRPGS